MTCVLFKEEILMDTRISSHRSVSSFSIIRNTDVDCGIVVLHSVAHLLCNRLLHKFTIESDTELCVISAGVQRLWGLPCHVAAVIIGSLICLEMIKKMSSTFSKCV